MLASFFTVLGRGPMLILMALGLALVGLTACQTGDSAARGVAPLTADAAGAFAGTVPVAVTDFAVDGAVIQRDSSVIGTVVGNSPIARLTGSSGDGPFPARAANLFAETLVAELRDAGVPAVRLRPGIAPPPNAWLVRGRFTALKEGSAGAASLIGFGAGNPEVAVIGEVVDLGAPGQPTVAFIGEDATGRRMPGGLITRNPAAIAAKAVMSAGSFDREVKNLAEAVAEGIVKAMKGEQAVQ